jgi:hypothetical protein
MKGRSSRPREDGDSTSPCVATAGDHTNAEEHHAVDDISQGGAIATARTIQRTSTTRPSPTRPRKPSSYSWEPQARGTEAYNELRPHTLHSSSGDPTNSAGTSPKADIVHNTLRPLDASEADTPHGRKVPSPRSTSHHPRLGAPCSLTTLVVITTLIGIAILGGIVSSSQSLQLDQKGCRMSYMRPSYIHLKEFDTEHTRFATKYSLHLYREQGIDDGRRVGSELLRSSRSETFADVRA